MVLRWVLPSRVRDELHAMAAAEGRPKSRLVEDVWDRQRKLVAGLTPARSLEVHQMRAVGGALQAAREHAALAGGALPKGASEELLYVRDGFAETLERESQRLDVDEAALLLFCWQRDLGKKEQPGLGYSWEQALCKKVGWGWSV